MRQLTAIMARSLSSRAIEWTVIGIFALSGLAFAWAVLMPLGQWLIDYYDDDVVFYTVRYFKYWAVLISVVFCIMGGFVGKQIMRSRVLLVGMAVTVMPAWAFAGDTKKSNDGAKKRPAKILLFLNIGGSSLQMTSEEPIRRVLDAGGKVILDLDPTKAGTDGYVATEYKDCRFASVYWWFYKKRTSVSVSPKSRGRAKITLETDSGKKQSFEIIVLVSALAIQPGGTLPLQPVSKKPIKQVEVENEKIVSVKVDPADPSRAVIKGLAQGFSTVRLNPGSNDEETLEVAVYPEKITEDKVLIVSAGANYFIHMSSRKTIARVKNSDEKVLEVSSLRDSPDCISFRTFKAGFMRLELGAEDNSTESFAIFVVDPKK
jgi:hypothetical protein